MIFDCPHGSSCCRKSVHLIENLFYNGVLQKFSWANDISSHVWLHLIPTYFATFTFPWPFIDFFPSHQTWHWSKIYTFSLTTVCNIFSENSDQAGWNFTEQYLNLTRSMVHSENAIIQSLLLICSIFNILCWNLSMTTFVDYTFGYWLFNFDFLCAQRKNENNRAVI